GAAVHRDAALAGRAEAPAAVDAALAVRPVAVAGVERGEGAVVAGPELLAGQVEGRVARVAGVLAGRGDVDRRPPELPLEAEVAVVAVRVEEDPEVPAGGDRGHRGIVVVVHL